MPTRASTSRAILAARRYGATTLCWSVFALSVNQASGQAAAPPPAPATAAAARHLDEPAPTARQRRSAEDAYLAGAKKLDRDDLAGAEREFARALALDPGNRDYAAAISVAREHQIADLIQQAGAARLKGEPGRAEQLIAEARALDPTNPLVLQHTGPLAVLSAAPAAGQASPGQRPTVPTKTPTQAPLSDRTQMLRSIDTLFPAEPVFTGAIQLSPDTTVHSFHLRGDAQTVLRRVAEAYGIRVTFDDSAPRTQLRFDVEGLPYTQAMPILMSMAHVFAVPFDPKAILVANDDLPNRARLQRQMEETIYLPGMTVEQINELANVIRNIFEVKQASVETSLERILVRAPEETLGPMNLTLADLIDANGEVMIEVKLYEVNTTHGRVIGAALPAQAGLYNVDAAATALVNANQTLVQQAIAQGLIPATASNIEIAFALIASGLVQSTLLSSTIGFFGKGLTATGITASTNTTFNLSLNTSDTRALDDVQIHVGDREPGIFRAGTRYPITTSTYTSGLSTLPPAASSATINGVSVASLLAQYAGGTSATIPQVSYEDLGVTLKATPTVQKSGNVSMALDMKIEALTGGSLNGIPILGSRQFVSTITVNDGDTVLLVSNLNRSETSAVTGVPGLSELPGFQVPTEQNAEMDRAQLLVLVTPHIIRRRSNMIAGPRILVRPQEPASD